MLHNMVSYNFKKYIELKEYWTTNFAKTVDSTIETEEGIRKCGF